MGTKAKGALWVVEERKAADLLAWSAFIRGHSIFGIGILG